jgi:hypothetical protein
MSQKTKKNLTRAKKSPVKDIAGGKPATGKKYREGKMPVFNQTKLAPSNGTQDRGKSKLRFETPEPFSTQHHKELRDIHRLISDADYTLGTVTPRHPSIAQTHELLTAALKRSKALAEAAAAVGNKKRQTPRRSSAE